MAAARGWGALLVAALMALAMPGGVASAQDADVVRSPVLTVDPDALFARSQFGQAFDEKLVADSRALEAENRRLEDELATEEQELTSKRAEMSPADFRDLADAFDSKVQRIRSEQQAKARALGERGDKARRRFFSAAAPVLQSIMQEAGAAVIIDKRSVFMSANIVDVTQLAVERVNAEIGDGADLPEVPDDATTPGDDIPGAAPNTPRADGAVRLPPADAAPEGERP
ncbi:OmpH family outer membrane protein [Sediminimonas sp.]|uniref:OmpH family outer membrane protein n=1 Tax=Sediminimonas sp. TaxID=2823379 RepID=UPI0025F6E6A5|nr:OmpH family outer membrane protein [Sediminimonas sp.]